MNHKVKKIIDSEGGYEERQLENRNTITKENTVRRIISTKCQTDADISKLHIESNVDSISCNSCINELSPVFFSKVRHRHNKNIKKNDSKVLEYSSLKVNSIKFLKNIKDFFNGTLTKQASNYLIHSGPTGNNSKNSMVIGGEYKQLLNGSSSFVQYDSNYKNFYDGLVDYKDIDNNYDCLTPPLSACTTLDYRKQNNLFKLEEFYPTDYPVSNK